MFKNVISKSLRTCFLLSSSISKNSRNFSRLTKNLSVTNCITKSPNFSAVSYQVRFAQTEVEKKLEEYLKDEIALEEGEKKKFGKKVGSFDVTKTEGPNVVLSRSVDGQEVRVKFSVNNSVADMHDDEEQQEEHQENEEPFMPVSRPHFVVEIDKGKGDVLAIQCTPGFEASNSDSEGFEIQEVALLKQKQEWTDDTYSLSSIIMDGDMYDRLMELLEEKGVDEEFVQNLVEWSTAYEHHSYVDLLNNIKGFASV